MTNEQSPDSKAMQVGSGEGVTGMSADDPTGQPTENHPLIYTKRSDMKFFWVDGQIAWKYPEDSSNDPRTNPDPSNRTPEQKLYESILTTLARLSEVEGNLISSEDPKTSDGSDKNIRLLAFAQGLRNELLELKSYFNLNHENFLEELFADPNQVETREAYQELQDRICPAWATKRRLYPPREEVLPELPFKP